MFPGMHPKDSREAGRAPTQKQLDMAFGDDRTVLPEDLTRPAHWSNAANAQPEEPDNPRQHP